MKQRIYNNIEFSKALSNEEIKEYFIKANNGDEEAKKIIIEHNRRLVTYTIKRYFPLVTTDYPFIEMEDIISTGTIGLIIAVDTYKLDEKVCFSTYAMACIKNEIIKYLNSMNKSKYNVSINSKVKVRNNENDLALEDFLKSKIEIEDQFIDNEQKRIIKEALNILNPLEKQIIELHYGFNSEPLTFFEIGIILGYSSSHIGKVELKAKAKLTKYLLKQGVGKVKRFTQEIIDLKLSDPKDIALYLVNKIIDTNMTVEDLAKYTDYNLNSIRKRITGIIPYLDEETKDKLLTILKSHKEENKKINENKLNEFKRRKLLISVEDESILYEAVEELPTREKEIFLSRYPKNGESQKTYSEISETYNIKMGSINSCLERTIKKIKVILLKRNKTPEVVEISKPFFDFTEHKNELKELIDVLEDELEQTILLLRLGFMNDTVYKEDEIAFFLEMDVRDIHKTIDNCLRKLLALSKEPLKTEEYIQQKLTLTKEN